MNKPVFTLNELRLNKDQRGAIIGQTGTGKSVLAKQLIPGNANRIAIIDPKRTFSYDLPIFTSAREIYRRKPKRFIYRPKPSLLGNLLEMDDVYRYVYNLKDCFLYTDDIVGVLTNTKYPHFLQVCYQMGRELNIACLASFQRPYSVPLFLMSEASKFYAFRTVLANDIKRVNEFVPSYTPLNLPDKHTFFYYDTYKSKEPRQVKIILQEKK